MKLQAIIFLAFTAFLTGCKSKTAFEYSQTIVKIESGLASEIVEADKVLTRLVSNNQNDSAAIIAGQMEAMADSRLKQVQELKAPDVDEGENFKRAAVHYFTYLKTFYTSLNKMTRATTGKEKEDERIRLAKIVDDKDNAIKALQRAQQKFATANNFRIEKVNGE